MTTIVVLGTDTDVGKTVFAAGLTAALGASYWKPVQSGLEGDTDSQTVQRLAGLPDARVLPEAYRLNSPLSPHRSAEIDGVEIDPDRLVPPQVEGSLVIEGAGGVLVPLTRKTLFADVIAGWGLPAVLVGRTALGAINHALLSIEALRARGVPLLGVAFAGEEIADTQRTIAEMGKIRQLGRLPVLDPLDPQTLQAAFADAFDTGEFRA
ncbi:dethiobiotin synthase [Hoeflea sp.]|uniref:dethiobiotin synthase n=1 Tax=Hoeflea sp. TaxID=1940281 RepID=UPI003B0200C3